MDEHVVTRVSFPAVVDRIYAVPPQRILITSLLTLGVRLERQPVEEAMLGAVGRIDWGTAPDWASAAGTTAAFLTALYVILRDHAIARRREQQERARQARLIFTWIEPYIPPFDPRHTTMGYFSGEVEITVRNESNSPIFDCIVGYYLKGSIPQQSVVTGLPESVSTVCDRRHSIAVGTTSVRSKPDYFKQPGRDPYRGDVRKFTSYAIFTDTNGLRWYRDSPSLPVGLDTG